MTADAVCIGGWFGMGDGKMEWEVLGGRATSPETESK